MKIHIDINDKYEGSSITIQSNVWTEDLEAILQKLNGANAKKLVGIQGEQSILLSPDDIEFVYAENRKVFAVVEQATVELKLKLYEVETLLKDRNFTRFSKSVIGNITHIERFELSFNGNLCVYFKSGNKEYVTRKYVQILKDKIIMGGNKNGI
ncbi:LytTR family DNA-binding domain-containing protein [Alkalihalobacillus sp. AL-G]|uniref:LytTR family DNA-binding domain-containing protein n=1 Tax=Alkalihalobacillus sp. AL-G TaxID=2926399 RepID=UPI00272BBDE6|nr:LytTR family DNA-binding domain-containing protein [Alkalihalobacillus sp. AL-G]WLD92548.1 LytTR family transcriptional regulator [Alkalihalobacillus sp. AL-G]